MGVVGGVAVVGVAVVAGARSIREGIAICVRLVEIYSFFNFPLL